jgi:DNA-binding NarL/FixJ family response regulator
MNEIADSKSKKILIVEDHPLFRAMLRQLVEKELEMTVCGETDNIGAAMAIIEQVCPDLAIVDITLPGASGLELIKNIKALGLPVPVLILSMHEEKLYAERVIRAGGRGYISKQEAPSEVVKAIRNVLAGGLYVSERVSTGIVERLGHLRNATGPEGMETLSDREVEVFLFIGQGLNSREISKRINLGQSTVDTYRQRIKEKMGLKNAAELYQRAVQWVAERGMKT